jgi:hypothetical protein
MPLNPNEQPPGDSSPRITLSLSRDTLLLIGAMLFLAVAILLAVIFPRGAGTPSTGAPTAPPTSTAGEIGRATPETILPAPTTQELPLATPQAPYPDPGQVLGSAPTSESALAATPDPLRPTDALGATTPTDAGFSSQATAYPVPLTTVAPMDDLAATATAAASGVPLAPTLVPALLTPVTQPTFTAPTAAGDPPTATPVPPTAAPATPAGPSPTPQPRPTRAPTAVPIDQVRGTTYWRADRGPISVSRDVLVVSGASLIIEPGAEVRLAPGVSIFVDGQLYALGQPGSPVRFIGRDRPRWEGVFGRAGSTIVLENIEVSGGGAGGTLIASEGGSLAIRGGRLRDNGGHVRAIGSSVEVRDTEIAGNDMPYGSPLDIIYTGGGTVTLTGNRVGGNRLAPGVPPARIGSQSPFDTLTLDVQRNLLIGQDGPNLTLETNGPLRGNVVCNTFAGGLNGLSVRSTLPQTPGLPDLVVRNNAIESHTPPILPIYLDFGIGRGATSEVALDMRENWWESDTGPYEPSRHADGRGEAVGDNIEFAPWLQARPECAPRQ